jgi:hypothetical protein
MSEREPRDDNDALIAKYTAAVARYTAWLVIATVLSAIAAGLTAWITWDLKDFAAQQSKDTVKALELTQKAVDAAGRQASLAEAANTNASDTAERQLRAYVIISRPEKSIDGFVEIAVADNNKLSLTKKTTTRHLFQNVGQTPAYDINFLVSEKLITSSMNETPKSPSSYETSRTEDGGQFLALGAGKSDAFAFRNASGKGFTDAELNEFKNGKKAYVFWGIVYYRDIFKHQRYTRFCRYYESGDLNNTFSCADHNDAN